MNLTHPQLFFGNEAVERVTSFKFLGVTVIEDLSWGNNTATVIAKAQQCLSYV